jgi:membrane-bound hydrogenase subunit beta
MPGEDKIKNELTAKFGFLNDKITMKRERRIFADVPSDSFLHVFDFAVNHLHFSFLSIITGLDDGDKLSCLYHLANSEGVMLNLRLTVDKNKPVIKTITSWFPGGEIYERELVDMFGITVEGLKPGKRYPLPDGWPEGQYPLRKEWKKEMLGDFKGGING